jgi:hypothetical protein
VVEPCFKSQIGMLRYINLPRVVPPQLLISRHETDTRTTLGSCISNSSTSEVHPTICHDSTEGRV